MMMMMMMIILIMVAISLQRIRQQACKVRGAKICISGARNITVRNIKTLQTLQLEGKFLRDGKRSHSNYKTVAVIIKFAFAEEDFITVKFVRIKLKEELTAHHKKFAMLANAETDVLFQTVDCILEYNNEK